jgi:hypothetical protein
MSGVLGRMVQRSRGQLPAIEPLVRSQKTAAAAVPLVVEESAVPEPRAHNAAVSGRERASRDESAGLVQDKVKRDAPQASVPAPKDSRRSDAIEVASVKRDVERDGTPAAKGAHQAGSKIARLERVDELRDMARESEELNVSSFEIHPQNVLANVEDATGESIRPRAKLEQRPATPDISTERNKADAASSANDEPQQTEIHITIGSVELRSPRVAPVAPKAPPFRPRVTLDEFLKRGAGSGGWGAKS